MNALCAPAVADAVLQADGLAQSGDFFKVRRKMLSAFYPWCSSMSLDVMGSCKQLTCSLPAARQRGRTAKCSTCWPMLTAAFSTAGAYQLPHVGAQVAAHLAGNPGSKRRHHLLAGVEPLW
jgi:hypothetical protein